MDGANGCGHWLSSVRGGYTFYVIIKYLAVNRRKEFLSANRPAVLEHHEEKH